MLAILALALFAVANGYVSEKDFIPSQFDALGHMPYGNQLWGNRMWGSPLTGAFPYTQRTRFMGHTSPIGHPMTTFGGFGTGFTDIHMVKAKLIQGIPCDINDFAIVKHTLPYVPQEEMDDIEEILKKKFNFGIPEVEIHRFEAAILKECVKVKVERGLPIDKLESKVLREAIKAKVIRGDPVDEKEAKICANNIKNKLIKGKPIDPLDAEVLLDFVKNKVSRREPITNLEAELCLELLKLKTITGEPLDTVEAEIVVECVRNKARRGSPLDRVDEDLLINVVQNKELIHRVGNRALELAVEVMKNKEKRGEPIMSTIVQTPVIPHELKQPFSLLDKTNFDDKIRFIHKSPMRPFGMRTLQTPFGINPWTVPFRGLHTMGLGSTWNRCPVTGFYDMVGQTGLYSPYNVMNLRYSRGLTTPFRNLGFNTPLTRLGTWGNVLPTWNLV